MDSDKKNDSIYRIVFDQIDADGDGKLSKAEFEWIGKGKEKCWVYLYFSVRYGPFL